MFGHTLPYANPEPKGKPGSRGKRSPAASWLGTASLSLLLFAAGVRGQSDTTASIAIRADRPGVEISSNLFGIFFEEINFAGEGGLYGEMIRNRSLDNSMNPDYWTLATQGTASGQISVDTSLPMNTNNTHSLKLTMTSGNGSVGAANSGFWGIALQQGAQYDLSFYANGGPGGFTGPVNFRLENASGSQTYASGTFSGLTANWQHFIASFTPTGSDTNARLVLSISQPGSVWLDVISLFPHATFHNRTNGMRTDLANMLQALHPSFMRFPGGNYIEGTNLVDAVRWKTTIGDIADRPGHRNSAWGYWSTDGLGYHEFLQLCEDLGCEPLFVINCGLALGYNGNTNNTVPLDQMGPWVQDALDAIQYANGSTNTYWGAKRAANGHPAPFNLKYMEIGNENGGSYYNDRYALFYDAIKSNYPNMHLIADVWGGIPSSRPVEIQDEHYYTSPATFVSYANKYDTYDRNGPKVYVGEYAVTQRAGTWGNLSAALGEAVFMTGMERNSDEVLMASYAPLFANVNDFQWKPDAIYYDNYRVFGTPSYYVQEMFSQNRGDLVLPTAVTISNPPTSPPPHGAIGLGSWNTSVQYSNVVVTSNGVILYQSDFSSGAPGWQVYNGNWSTSNGVYRQTAQITDCRSTTGDTNWSNYTINLKARKTGGAEGFLILFNWLDDNNWTWWNIGGWGNTLDAIEQMVDGGKSIVGRQIPESINTNQWYDLRIVLTGPRVQTYLDDQLVQDVSYPTSSLPAVVASASYARSDGQIIVKAVNPSHYAVDTTFHLDGLDTVAPSAQLIQLTSSSGVDENSLDAPTHVYPVTNAIDNAATNFTLTLPADSLSILRLQASGIHTFTNLQVQADSPIIVGQSTTATLWAWEEGLSSPINLSTNLEVARAIHYSTSDTNLAVVDSDGNVSGVGRGIASLIATYNGLSATQSIEVIRPVVPPATLIHRYSFNDGTANDSIGNANGLFRNASGRASIAGGQLNLAGMSGDYVDLGPGLVSTNLPSGAVTLEAWATFYPTNGAWTRLFDFGSISNGDGENYIFFTPNNAANAGSARLAVSDASPGYNHEVKFSLGNLLGQTNVHVVAVFDPLPGRQFLGLYLNGVLVGSTSSDGMTLGSINDAYSFLGHSLYSNDAWLNGSIDEFRIYDGELNSDEVAATQLLGPDQLLSQSSPVIGVSSGNGNLTLSWPLASAGFTLQSRTNLSVGDWTDVSSPVPEIVNGQWQVNLPLAENARYLRLKY